MFEWPMVILTVLGGLLLWYIFVKLTSFGFFKGYFQAKKLANHENKFEEKEVK